MRETNAWAQWARCTRAVWGVALAMLLAACGGSGGGGGAAAPSAAASSPTVADSAGSGESSNSVPPLVVAPTTTPPTAREAARFLTQASFGPTDASIQRVVDIGYAAWIDEQLALPPTSHLAIWDANTAALRTVNTAASAGLDGTINAFWRGAIAGDDQLRQRVTYALSQIFVISLQDTAVGNEPRAAAHYLDVLSTRGLGSYRGLLESVALHPMMGKYLSSLGNRKADTRTGRVPDENFAREVMQLFSVGLAQLDTDGTPRLRDGAPIETFGPADITGLARVFTGWSWACPVAPTASNNTCFSSGSVTVSGASQSDADRTIKPMINYPGLHATEEKSFLGTTIPANTDGPTSLRLALDALAAHPNIGPFIGRQMIQRLVTSNPSPAYVRDVALAFNRSGGDMKVMVKAILLHPEARTLSADGGKVKEPVLRLTAFLRAFNASSDSGFYKIGNTDDPATRLGQSPLRAPSVFNFYRPGYVPPGSAVAAAGRVAPELQITHETSVAGYVNYMRTAAFFGAGVNPGGTLNRPDVQVDYTAELAVAHTPEALVERVNTRLLNGDMPAAMKTEIVNALTSITIPTNNASYADLARKQRVAAAVLLTLVSPEFQVQK
ncbi:MAG: DUF1800 domain-containing protein [Rhizobacter sp.]